MSNGADGRLFSNIAATTAAFRIQGGRYVVSGVAASVTTNSMGLQALEPDGSTWNFVNQSGGTTAASIGTSASSQSWWMTVDLPPGQYRVFMNTATGVYAALAAIPGNSL